MARKTKAAVKRNTARAISRPGSFGPVSQINTAPVSVGNSVRGSKPRITQTTNGARVVGRDFAFALASSDADITHWELIGGMPITPCALPSSVLRNYCQMFQKFKVHKIVVHYITSSPTSQAGDIMFYYERDPNAPMCDYTSSNFLPFVLSDPNTVIGPQWTNHSMLITPIADWKSTLFGNQIDLSEQVAGSLFLFSKTNSANSPGYILIDYDISFKELSVNPRAGSLPVARAQNTMICLTAPTSLTAGSGASFTVETGKTISDTVSAGPTGWENGDVYKAVLQVTSSTKVNAAWSGTGTTPTTANLLRYRDDTTISLDDGFTVYFAVDAGTWYPYATLDAARNASKLLEWNVTATAASVNVCATVQLVSNFDKFTQSSY
nr:MAG: hypothetical protein 3 [Luteoviridae sp.]